MKKIITIVLTAVLFFVATALGVNSVFRVDSIELKINYVSEEAKTEAESLRNDLAQLYEKESSFKVGASDAESVFAKYPYFRLTDFKKEYPNKLVIEATEDAEVFSVKNGDSYYILSLDGTILSIRESSENRSDGKANVLLNGIEISGEKGQRCIGEKLNRMLPLLQELSVQFNGLRSNLVEVNYSLKGGSIEQYDITTREGVIICVQRIDEFVSEKAEKISKLYFSLEDGERLKGYIYATNGSEKATVVYNPTEIFFE